MNVARESGVVTGDGSESGGGRGGAALDGVDVANVHLDELPSYQEAGRDTRVAPHVAAQTPSPAPDQGPLQPVGQTIASPVQATQQATSIPNEPPPGYDETQRAVVEDELQRRLSGARIE